MRIAERGVSSESSFDAKRAAKAIAEAEAAIAALEEAKADHPKIADYRKRLDAARDKADELAVKKVKYDFESGRRSAGRDIASWRSARERDIRNLNPGAAAKKIEDWVKRVRDPIDEATDDTKSERGQALLAEVEAWYQEMDAKLAEVRLVDALGEAVDARVEAPIYGEMRLLSATESVDRNLSRNDPERVVAAWDAVKKLIPRVQDPRFESLPEAKEILERHKALEERVAKELRPMLAKVRGEPIIRSASELVELIQRDTDNRNEENVIRWRQQLREKIEPLIRDWKDEPIAKDFLEECEKAFAYSEAELGEGMVIKEIQAVEAFVKPLVERLERALARKSAPAVSDHAPPLRAKLPALDPFLSKQRAQVLKERAEAALARIEKEMGAEVAKAIAEAVPRFAIDVSWDAKVQRILQDVNAQLEMYRDQFKDGQQFFDERVDLDNGSHSGITDMVYRDIESKTRTLIDLARRVEKMGKEPKQIDRERPAVAAIADAAPKLVKRARAWKEKIGKKCEYANAIDQARSNYESAQSEARMAATGNLDYAVERGWPSVLAALGCMDEEVAEATKTLPDDHEEADAWAAKAAALRAEVVEKLKQTCIAEAARLAIGGQMDAAKRFADALKSALPDAPENEQLAKAIAGSADARMKAEAEIRERAAMIRARAEEAAKAARAKYDAWPAERKPVVALGGTIVQQIDRFEGKWVAGSNSSLGSYFPDGADEIQGGVYWIDYDPAVREALEGGMKKLRDLHARMVEAVMKKHGVTGLSTTSGYYPEDAVWHCEIVWGSRTTRRSTR